MKDDELEKYSKMFKGCYDAEETFTLRVGEACRLNDDYVGNLPHDSVAQLKLMYHRVNEHDYRWLDCDGQQGIDKGPLEFYQEHWVKV